jgi:hypothetical protein
VTYCFDTSALIDLGERYYPERIKVFEPIWEFLYHGIDNGTVFSVEQVRTELNEKADEWRKSFLGKTENMFLMHQGIEVEYASVIEEIDDSDQFRVNKHHARFMDGADPWVIALARTIEDSVVVHAETKSLREYGMGPVCDELGVRQIRLLEFIETNEIGP